MGSIMDKEEGSADQLSILMISQSGSQTTEAGSRIPLADVKFPDAWWLRRGQFLLTTGL